MKGESGRESFISAIYNKEDIRVDVLKLSAHPNIEKCFIIAHAFLISYVL